MAEITIDDVRLISDGQSLKIVLPDDRSDLTAIFDAEGIEKLLGFVNSNSETSIDQRRSFRVPIYDWSGLKVQIRKDEKQLPVHAKDISVTGIFLMLAPDDPFDLSIEETAELVLEFEDETQIHPAIVKRHYDDGIGFLFSDSIKDGQADPPAELSKMVMELQRRWIARRVKKK